jgi:Zn-dependent peptidase ImmA (M78 family)
MYVDSKKIENLFRKIKQIQEHKDMYCLNKDHVPISVDDVKYVISDMYSLKIGIQEVMYEGTFLRSIVERYNNNHALIYVKHDLANDLKRFSATKELMHLAIDEKEDWSTDGVETVSSYLVEMSLSTENGKMAKNGAQSEALAEVAAIEILYPYRFRDVDREKVAAQPNALSRLALEYEIPKFIVGRALSNSHCTLADKFWKLVTE